MKKDCDTAWKDFMEQNPNTTVTQIEVKLDDMAIQYKVQFRAQPPKKMKGDIKKW